MEQLRVADALTELFVLFKRCNKYIDETEPWVLAKDEAKKVIEAWQASDPEAKAATLRKRLSRLRAALRANGVEVETDKRGGNRAPKDNKQTTAEQPISEQIKQEKAKPANDALTIIREVRKLAALYSPDIDVDEYLIFQSVIKKLESYLKHDV